VKDLDMESKWNKLHSIERFRPKYPTDIVVRFMFTQFSRNIKDRGDLKILDMGCGAGRHTIFLAREGFQAFGTDISEEGLNAARERFKEERLEGTLKKSNMQEQPFVDNFFDGAISFGVLYYNDRKGFENTVSETFRILKKGGKALVFARTTDDYRYGKGGQIERNSFILDIEDTNEKNMIMHFLDREEINVIFNKFSEITVEKTETTFSNLKKKNSDWIIIIKK